MAFIPDVRRALSHAWSAVRARLLPDATAIAKRAWSLRFIELAAAADIILNFVPFVADWLPRWMTLLLLAGAWLARLLPQPEPPAVAEPEKEAPNADQ